MTPEEISRMSDRDLNIAIAKKKGWSYIENWNVCVRSNPPDMKPVPDYCNQWGDAGPLLEEMAKKILGFSLSLFSSDNQWVCSGYLPDKSPLDMDNSDRPTRAIAEAWLTVNGGG